MDKKIINEAELDEEWIQLICEAKRLGIEKDEIRNFFKSQKVERNMTK